MLVSNLDEGTLETLVLLVVGSVLFLHFLLFRKYFYQEKINLQKLRDLEKLVKLEVLRSQSLSKSVDHLQEIKSKMNEKLEVIRLQVEGMKAREGTRKAN